VDVADDEVSCIGGGGGGSGNVAALSWLLVECTPLDDSLWPLHAACGEWPAADASDSDLAASSSKSSVAVTDAEQPPPTFAELPAIARLPAVLYMPWYMSFSCRLHDT